VGPILAVGSLTTSLTLSLRRKERKTAMRTLKDKLNKLNSQRRKKVEARAAQLIAEEITRRELRQARKLTQVRLAKALGITQDGVSRLEKRADLLLSTLRQYMEAMGGTLSLIAEFRNREPILLSGIAEEEEPRTALKKPSRAAEKALLSSPRSPRDSVR
jgi:transcriptional regulator with XRE-family HTH domain